MRRRRGIMGLNGGAVVPIITATATGNPLSFVTDMVRPLKSLVIPFTPIQEGSGDPSPDNVRPISGWTGCEISVNGTPNLLKPMNDTEFWLDGYIKNTGAFVSDSKYRATGFVKVKPNQNYTYYVWQVDGTTSFDGWKGLAFYDSNMAFIPGTFREGTISQVGNVVSTSDTMYVRVYTKPDVCPQLEFGSRATAYTDYQGTKLAINWQSEAGTIYGGTLTLNEDGSADLVSTRRNAVASSFSKISSWSGTPYVEFSLPGASGTAGNARADFQCSMFKPGGRAAGNMFRISTKCYLFISPETTLEDMNAVASQIQVVYPLATSQTYHFDNIGQLITFLGTNTIWTDTNGTNTATYLKHQS